ncbi:MAG: nitroreductase family protein [Bacteroidales bacterium]|nr:nitroreductase family protein [Bacteroidales bacterium]
MNFEELVFSTRSFRRFDEEIKIDLDVLKKLVGFAHSSASSGNIQGLKFAISVKETTNAKIFNCLKWAFYLKDWEGPVKGERPVAYIIILGDTEIHETIEIDVGIAAQSILLGAVALGFGGCMIGSIDRLQLRKELEIPKRFQIPLVIALGKPVEKVVTEETDDSGNIEYWRDSNGTHFVPKRPFQELIIEL